MRRLRLLFVVLIVALFESRRTAPGQTSKPPVPEFFGVYAIDGGQLFALVNGKSASAPPASDLELVSIVPPKGTAGSQVPEFSPQVRFVVFDAAVADMLQKLTLFRLPHLRNVVERPDVTQLGMSVLAGDRRGASVKALATLNKLALARLPELGIRLLSKPVAGQQQMVELVPEDHLSAGVYGLSNAPLASRDADDSQAWVKPFIVEAAGQGPSPLCIDLVLLGGFGGPLDNPNVMFPLLRSDQYVRCDAAPGSSTAAGVRRVPSSATPVTAPSGPPPASTCVGRASCVAEAEARLNAGYYSQAATAWDKAAADGDTALSWSMCREGGLRCSPGTLFVGPHEVRFADDKGKTVFSAPPGDVSLLGTETSRIALSDRSVGRLRIRVAGKDHGLNYIPGGIADCHRTRFYHCPSPGPDRQLAVAEYIGTLITKPRSGPPDPPENAAAFMKPLREGDYRNGQEFKSDRYKCGSLSPGERLTASRRLLNPTAASLEPVFTQ